MCMYIHYIDSVSLETLSTPLSYLLFLPLLLPHLFLISMSFRSDFVLLSTHFQVQRLEWIEEHMIPVL